MDQPLGRCAGNAPEVRESVETLLGRGPDDVTEITLMLAGHMLVQAGLAAGPSERRGDLKEKLKSGEAFRRFQRMVELQGGDAAALENGGAGLPQAAVVKEIRADSDGFVTEVDAEKIGRACLLLGTGRARVEDGVDLSAGMSSLVKRGEEVRKGDLIGRLHTSRASSLKEAEELACSAVKLDRTPPAEMPLILDVLGFGASASR